MKDPKEATLIIEQGRTLRQWFRLRVKQTGEVLDLPDEGYNVARLQVRDKHASDGGEVLLELTTANGGIVLGEIDDGTGALWSGYIYASAAATGHLDPLGEAVYDMIAIHDNGEIDTIRRGPAVLIKAVTT